MTAVEFSAEHPYGKAVALLDLKSGCLKVGQLLIRRTKYTIIKEGITYFFNFLIKIEQAKEEWFILPGLISAFILSHILKKKGHIDLTIDGKNMKEMDSATQEVKVQNNQHANRTASIETEVNSNDDVTLKMQ